MNHPRPYQLRIALPEDIPFLNGIELASARRLPVDILPEPLRSDAVPQEMLREAQEAGMLWVVTDQGALCRAEKDTPIGYCLLQSIRGLALLSQIDVAEEHGRRGLGRALVQKAIKRAQELGFGWLYLTTFENIPWNAPFYASMGFERVPEGGAPGTDKVVEPSSCAATGLPAVMRNILAEERQYLSGRIAMRKRL